MINKDVDLNGNPINYKKFLNVDEHLTSQGKEALYSRYMYEGQTIESFFESCAYSFATNEAHGERMLYYIRNRFFCPATPVLAHASSKRSMPISCFLLDIQDSLDSIVNKGIVEMIYLSSGGGGLGSHWGNIRPIGEKVGKRGSSGGVIPLLKMVEAHTTGIAQGGSTRSASSAIYYPVDGFEIDLFLNLRRPRGGDPGKKCHALHHGVCISDDFMYAVQEDRPWHLVSPHTGETLRVVRARDLWETILAVRMETGEPYMFFSDAVYEGQPKHQKDLGLRCKFSNLCSEITLPSGIDYLGRDRTAVCCLGSVNLETFDQWKFLDKFIGDCIEFLDNVLTYFIENVPEHSRSAAYSAYMERSIGLGRMGFHSLLQEQMIPFDSVSAKILNKVTSEHIYEYSVKASKKLALKRGSCPDAFARGVKIRNSNMIAIAPTASISVITNTSPGIDPITSNAYTHKSLGGSYIQKNKTLSKLMQSKNIDRKDVWYEIMENSGSVATMSKLFSPHERNVFKTAYEIPPKWVIDHAAERQPYVCQSQSLNLFLHPDYDRDEVHDIHLYAWKKGIKTLYYSRSLAASRPFVGSIPGSKNGQAAEKADYDECLSCQ